MSMNIHIQVWPKLLPLPHKNTHLDVSHPVLKYVLKLHTCYMLAVHARSMDGKNGAAATARADWRLFLLGFHWPHIYLVQFVAIAAYF